MCVYRWKGVGGHTLALFTGGKAPAGMIYDVFRRKGTGEHKKFFERKNSTMKKLNKKGFTIVELVIVIAVIAILAGVLIPTFASVVTKANQSKAMQEAKNEYEAYLAEYASTLTGKESYVIVAGDYAFEVTDGQFNSTAKKASEYVVSKKGDLTKQYKEITKAENDNNNECYSTDGKYTLVDSPVTGTKYFVVDTTKADLGSANVAIYAK